MSEVPHAGQDVMSVPHLYCRRCDSHHKIGYTGDWCPDCGLKLIPADAKPDAVEEVKRHPEHHGLKVFKMAERNFDRASRDTGDVPTRVTPMVAAYYYEDLLKKLEAAEQRIAALEGK